MSSLASKFDHIPPRINTILLSILVGLCTGLGVWLFTAAHELLHDFREHDLLPALDDSVGVFGVVILLLSVGLLVGWIMQTFIGEERHHGVAGIMEAVALAGGRMRYHRLPYKTASAILSIGGGASVGPEDPSVQIGANLGSMLGQKLGFSEDRIRLMVAAGSASAISAAFNAPIAGVFFALEVILGEFSSSAFGIVVLSSVFSSVFVKAIEVRGPELGIQHYTLGGPEEIPAYILLGLLCAPLAVAFMRMVYWQHDLWHHWKWSRPLKTAFAGAIVGGVAIFFPEIMGTGRETMNEVLNGEGEFTTQLLVTLVVFKILMTSVSMGGGFVGGIFAPSLFVGVMFGGAFGHIVDGLFPDSNVSDPAAYAIAGMAAIMAGVVRAPITAILLIFELTNDYQLILPIMLTTVVCVTVAEQFEEDGIYTLSLRRKGLRIQHGQDIDVMQSVTVAEAMVTPAPTITPTMTLTQLRDQFRQLQTKALCVVDEAGLLIGIVTMSDLQRAYESSNGQIDSVNITDIMASNIITITPHEAAWTAIQRMGNRDIGSIPVVQSQDSRQLVGLVRRHDIMRLYNIAIARKWEIQYHTTQIRLNTLVGEQVVEVQIKSLSPIAGQRVQDIHWPRECVVASIRRHQKVILPHGDTRLLPGDALVVVINPDCEKQLYELVEAHPE